MSEQETQKVLTPETSVEAPKTKSKEDRLRQDRPSLGDWLELRLGWWGFVRKNLDEPMPAGVGWWQTLGNLLLTLMVFQFTTGIALAIYYSAGPETAHASVKFINEGVQFWGINWGLAVRGLHVYGSAAIVVATVLHIIRVFYWGSYKKPRELTWVLGVFIFFVILGLSFTGYLLPWDQKAYWATVVGTNMAKDVPVLGTAIQQMLLGGPEVGAATLSRFYALHVMVLPAALIVLMGLHLYLVRKHHIAGPVVPQKGKPKPFYPDQLYKDAWVVLGGVAIIIWLAVVYPPGLEGVADPTGVDFTPKPEWYYLGLYELLKIMPKELKIVGTVVIPGVISLGMILLPWLDRSKSRHPAMRPGIIIAGTFIILMIGFMTMKGVLEGGGGHEESESTEISSPEASV
jgi:ubiquinol-cytochrome c reductase cytochrome b subunit